jgi:hypothetical protein
LVVLVLEHLEPSRVGAPDLHVVGSTSTLDIPRLVVVSSSDSQRLLMEVPGLGLSTIGNLEDHVSIVDKIKISSTWQFSYYMEISFNIESESFIEFTFLGLTLPFVNIHDVPLLVYLSVSSVPHDVLILSVNSTLDIQYFIVLDVSNESSIKSE